MRAGLWIGKVPNELAVLTPLEVAMISRAIPTVFVKVLVKGQLGATGGGYCVQNKVSDVVKSLRMPRPPSSAGFVYIRRNSSFRLERVRPDKIRAALVWLNANNKLYCDVTIDEEVMALLEREDQPSAAIMDMDQEGEQEAPEAPEPVLPARAKPQPSDGAPGRGEESIARERREGRECEGPQHEEGRGAAAGGAN